GRELRFGLKARWQFSQRRGGTLAGALGFKPIGVEAAVRFGQRRFSRGVTIDLALGIGVALARGIGLALRGAPGVARGSFSGGSGFELGFGGFQGLTPGGRIDACLLKLV